MKRHESAPPDRNRFLSGKAQRLSSPRRPPSAPSDNTGRPRLCAPRHAVASQPRRKPQNAVRLMQLGAENLIPANLKMRVYLLKVIPSPFTRAVQARPLGYSPQGDVSGTGRARSRWELCVRTSPGKDAHAALRGRGAVPRFQRLSSLRCKHFQQLSFTGTLPEPRTASLSAVGTNRVNTEQTQGISTILHGMHLWNGSRGAHRTRTITERIKP